MSSLETRDAVLCEGFETRNYLKLDGPQATHTHCTKRRVNESV